MLAARLAAAGIDSAALEARTLTGEVLGLDLTGLIAQGLRSSTRMTRRASMLLRNVGLRASPWRAFLEQRSSGDYR